MPRFGYLLCLLFLATQCTKKTLPASAGPTADLLPGAGKEWQFEASPVWTDEFTNEGTPDTTKWSYDVGGGGWGNNELEYYTAGDNCSVTDGILSLAVRKEERGGKAYTSTRMVSKHKGDFLYGRIEAKAMLPRGRGLWPAIWMLPTDWAYGGWPRSGEIDIMEQVGYDPFKVHMTVHTESYNHTKNTQKSGTLIVPSVMDSFHLYRVDWTPNYIKGYIDNKLVFNFANEQRTPAEWPFDKRFHLLLNVAVGGNWGGAQGVDDSIFPATMKVDYVRVYRLIQ